MDENELHINEEQGSLTPNTMPKMDHLGETKDPSLTGLLPKKDGGTSVVRSHNPHAQPSWQKIMFIKDFALE